MVCAVRDDDQEAVPALIKGVNRRELIEEFAFWMHQFIEKGKRVCHCRREMEQDSFTESVDVDDFSLE